MNDYTVYVEYVGVEEYEVKAECIEDAKSIAEELADLNLPIGAESYDIVVTKN